jgi:hypothetical protein
VYVDLVGVAEEDAAEALLGALRERAKPDRKPMFPGGAQVEAPTQQERTMPKPVAFPSSNMTQQNNNHGRDQIVINQPSGDLRIGGS